MEFKTLTYEQIEEWCITNGQGKWLLDKLEEQEDYKVYPKVKGEDGKMVADKSQEPHTEKRAISFISLKKAFVLKFMPEIAPKKKEAASNNAEKAKKLREKLGL